MRAYRNVFIIHYPDEEREAARPLRTAHDHDRMKKLGAIWSKIWMGKT